VTRIAGSPAATDLDEGAPRKLRITVEMLDSVDPLPDFSGRGTTDPDS
jgi:hypothetical protein